MSDFYEQFNNAIREEDEKKVRKLVASKPDVVKYQIQPADVIRESVVHFAVSLQSVKMIRLLVKLGADINEKSSYGTFGHITPAHLAAYFGNVEVLQTLKELGCHMKEPDCFHQTPLHTAQRYKRKLAVEYLCELVLKNK